MKTKHNTRGERFFAPPPLFDSPRAKIQNIKTALAKNSEKKAPVVVMKWAGYVAKIPAVGVALVEEEDEEM